MIQRALLALYPRSWRERYGDEYAALLEDTGMSLRIALDVARSALTLRVREHYRILSVVTILGQYACSLWLCVYLRITDNMLWLPTTFLKAAGLGATYIPLLYLLRICVRDTKLRAQNQK